MKMRCKKARKNISLALDGRLEKRASQEMNAHLELCPACREWRQEQLFMQEMLKSAAELQPVPDFFARLQRRINNVNPRPWFSFVQPYLFKPLWLRAALILLLMLSTAAGFFLDGPMTGSSPNSNEAVFNQTLNLDAFADLPGDSFGAVYDRLLQGEIR